MLKKKRFNRWLFTLVLLLVGVLSVTPFMDNRAAGDYEQLFQRAFVTFALARTINGVISVVQGTEVALQPAGVGVTLTPGEILDPVNDLVERRLMQFAESARDFAAGGEKGDDLDAVGLLEPREDDGGVESSRVCEYDLHAVDPICSRFDATPRPVIASEATTTIVSSSTPFSSRATITS